MEREREEKLISPLSFAFNVVERTYIRERFIFISRPQQRHVYIFSSRIQRREKEILFRAIFMRSVKYV